MDRTPSVIHRCRVRFELLPLTRESDDMGGWESGYPVVGVLLGFVVPQEPDTETIVMSAQDMDEWGHVWLRIDPLVPLPKATDRLHEIVRDIVWDIKSVKTHAEMVRCMARQMKGNR